MYPAFFGAHHGLAMLGVFLTLLWAGLALSSSLRRQPAGRWWRPAYIGAMATTGLSGLTGLVVLWLGGWLGFVFPYVGLAAVALHGVAGVRGRKALVAGASGRLAVAVAVAVQIVTLGAVYWLMMAKPF